MRRLTTAPHSGRLFVQILWLGVPLSLCSCRGDDSLGAFEAIAEKRPGSVVTGYNGPLIARLSLAGGKYRLLLYVPADAMPKDRAAMKKKPAAGWLELDGPFTVSGSEISLKVTIEPMNETYPTIKVKREDRDHLVLYLARGPVPGFGKYDEVRLTRAGKWDQETHVPVGETRIPE